MGIESKVGLEQDKSSKLSLIDKIRINLPYSVAGLIPLALAGIIGCYGISKTKENTKHPIATHMNPIIDSYVSPAIEVKEEPKPLEEKLELPFVYKTEDAGRREVFDIMQKVVLADGKDPKRIHLYMSVVEAETNFIADLNKSDGADKSLCTLISSRGAVGHTQLMTAAVPAGEKTLSKEYLVKKTGKRGSYSKLLKEYCKSIPRKDLLEADVRFDPEKNISYGIKTLDHCLARFRPGTHKLYTFVRNGITLGNKYSGSPPSKATATRTITIADSRESEKYALSCYNRGDSSLITMVVKSGSGSTGYSSQVMSKLYSHRRDMKPNPNYTNQKKADTDKRRKWEYKNKRALRS
jgi:hypothetical protein